jgi:hypothetical protein
LIPLGSLTEFQSSVTLVRHDENAPLGETRFGAGGPCVSGGVVGVRVRVGVNVGVMICAMGRTVTVVCRVWVLLPQRAVKVYVVVVPGATALEPGVVTPPIPGSMVTESAFVTAPQLSVVEFPITIDDGDALKDAMFGVPLQPDGGGGNGVGGVGVKVGVTGAGVPLQLRISANALFVSLLSFTVFVESKLMPMYGVPSNR